MEEIMKELLSLKARIERIERLVGKTRFTQEQARKALGLSRHTIIKYRQQGLLKGSKEGGRIYYCMKDIDKFLS